MRISWNWLSEFVDLSEVGTPEKLAELLTARGLEVEEIHPQGKGLSHVLTAQILERSAHPQADRLSLCQVTTGPNSEVLEIVCGAQNMKAGDKVALATLGAELPNGLKITQSKIRGVVSNGMLCSETELKLKESSEGILILPENTPLGIPLSQYLKLDDTILTFKLTANRGDCLSHLGMAREVAAALGKKIKPVKVKLIEAEGSPVSVKLNDASLCSQFWGCWIEGIKIGPSPDWVVRRLEALGSRSINNVVDASNLALFELGQPMHAYDGDRIEGQKITVRLGNEAEELPLLDGQTVRLQGSETVIADGKRAVGLAGVMGGGNSEVSQSTTRLFLECAQFSPARVRKAAALHQRKTEAAHRFERGVDPDGLHYAISRLAQLVLELAGGKIQGGVYAKAGVKHAPTVIAIAPDYFSEYLGMGSELTLKEVEKILTSLECEVKKGAKLWQVIPPSYRFDLKIKEDLVEEVGRSVGYDRIPSTVPPLTSEPTPKSSDAMSGRLGQMDQAKNLLMRQGIYETVNFAFTGKAWLEKLGIKGSVRVLNPLSEDLEMMVPSLLPHLIKNVVDNTRHHFGSEALPIRLFELRPTFHKMEGKEVGAVSDTETTVEEKWKLSLVVSGPKLSSGLRSDLAEVDFYDIKGILENLWTGLGARGIRLIPASESRAAGPLTHLFQLFHLFHPGQSVEVLAGNRSAGWVGLLHPQFAQSLKLKAPLWMVELDWETIRDLARDYFKPPQFKPWSEFPSMERDFALLVKEGVAAEKLTALALKAGKPLAKSAKVFDIYRGSQVAEGMTSVAVRVIFYDEARSIQESETEAASVRILEAWKKDFGIELR